MLLCCGTVRITEFAEQVGFPKLELVKHLPAEMVAFRLRSDNLSVYLAAYDRFAVFRILIVILKEVSVAILNQLSLKLFFLGIEIAHRIQKNFFGYDFIAVKRYRILCTVSYFSSFILIIILL